MCRTAVLVQRERGARITVEVGPRRVSMIRISDGWRAHDADAAKQLVTLARGPMPRARISKPVVPPKRVKVPKPAAAVTPPRRIEGSVSV